MDHDLLVFDENAELVDRYAPVLSAAVEAGEAVTAVLLDEHADAMHQAMGVAGAAVDYLDPAAVYVRPEDTIAGYDAVIRRHAAATGGRIRLIGELPRRPTGGPAGDPVATWAAYEALINHAFSHHPVSIHCVYDTRVASERSIEEALRSHPRMGGCADDNPDYEDPAARVAALLPPFEDIDELEPVAVGEGWRAFRAELAGRMRAAAVPEDALQGMLLACGEVVANARRSGGVRAVHAGAVGDSFVCEVHDGGPGVDDPLAGWSPPSAGHDRGAGLWVARQTTRRVEFGRPPGGSGIVRLWV
jgi:anti-sigma regulatory factor (Ser/Thr protein kinase)